MNKIVKKFFLAGKKLMPELHFTQPGLTYSACGLFTKYREWIQKSRDTGNLKHIYKNELDKTCFAHDETFAGSKELSKRTVSDKILKDRAYKIAINLKYNGYQRWLESMVFKFFDKKTALEASVNEELDQELHKSMIKKFKRSKVYATFKNNIRPADLAELRSLSSNNWGAKDLLSLTDVFTKYASVKHLKDKKNGLIKE